MKSSIRLLAFAVIISCQACTKDNTPPPVIQPEEKLLTIIVDASHKTSQTNDLVMVNDINGKLLAYYPFETGDTIVIKKTQEIKDNKINVTIIWSDTSLKYPRLDSYLYNDIGQVWTLQRPTLYKKESRIGQFNVKVKGVAAESSYQFSNRSHDLFGNGSWSGIDGLELTLDIHANSPDLFFHYADPAGLPKYDIIQNVQNGQTYNLSTNLLKEYDSKVSVSFPSTLTTGIAYTVNNVQSGQPFPKVGYVINGNFLTQVVPGNSTRSSITLGYLNSYTNYLTTLSVEYANKVKYLYERLGTKPEKIELPLKDSFAVTNKSISEYKIQHTKPFLQRNSHWVYRVLGSTYYWFISAPAGAPQVYPEMPAEVMSKYPLLTPAIFIHYTSTFTVQGDTYHDMIDRTFKGKARNASYEINRIEVW